jgi:light-regulated signal transduction histidine kinase (bacteriophytochrome)
VHARTIQLEAVNRELEAFSYSVSHDLRAPLRAVRDFGRILGEDHADGLDGAGRAHLDRILRASERMEELIEGLLELSRLGRAELRRDTVDLSRASLSVISELREAEPERIVETVIPAGLTLNADARLMRVVLENLLGNAWKFTANTAGSRIEVGCAQQAGETAWFVRDNGAGFDIKHADRLFVPFQRLHMENEFAGTGVGLATVQRIVQRHGGRVWAEGAPGKGATVWFTIPPLRKATVPISARTKGST